MKSFVSTQNKQSIPYIFVPQNSNKELQLFIERLVIIQSNVPNVKPTFDNIEIEEEAYFKIYLFNSASNSYVSSKILNSFLEYINANIPTEA